MANNKVQLSDGTVLLDLTGDTVTPENLLSGATAHNAAGNRINGAVAPVRYDAAQTLNDAQKTQARTNIAAAPDGFGLGTSAQTISTDWNEALSNGWWKDGNNNLLNRPFPGLWGIGLTTNYTEGSHLVQSAFWVDGDGSVYQKIRGRYQGGTWGAWEWVNPPMQLGVEYRTTERYMGKPVYVQAVNFGTLPNANTKSVTWAAPGVVLAVLSGEATSNYGEPVGLGTSLSGTEITATKTTLYIKSSGNYSDNTAVFRVKYTKTTD